MFVDFNILNQLGSPSINSNTFANRPAAGQTGRLFVSTDTFEIYRDNGTTWDLIGGPGSSTITGTGTATQVAYFTSSQAIGSSSNLYWDNTNIRLGIGTSTPGARLDIHGTGTLQTNNSTGATNNNYLSLQRAGSNIWRLGDTYNSGDNYFSILNSNLSSNAFAIYANTSEIVTASQETYSSGDSIGILARHNLTILDGYNITTAVLGAINSNININLQGSATIGATGRQGLEGNNVISFTGLGGTLTVTQGSTVRAYSSLSSVYAFNGVATGTITHLAGLRVCFPDNSGVGVNITNNYAILINDQTTGTGTVTYTNRWGIYQEGASDLNYFNGNLLIKSTTNTGEALQVTGTAKITSTLTANSLVKSGGTASQILAADGTVITAGTNITIAAGQISSTGGGISGSGTTNYLPKFTAATTLGDSRFFDDGTVTFLGNGDVNAAPSTGIFSGTGGTGTNIAGAELRIRGGASTGNAAGGPITFYTSAAGASGTTVRAATEVMRIASGGNVGINTTTINHQLAVVAANSATTALNGGNSDTVPAIVIQSGTNTWATATFGFAYIYSASTGDLDLYRKFNSTTQNIVMRWQRVDGNIGVGTTTIGSKFQINGNCAIGYSASTAAPTNGLQVAGTLSMNPTGFGTITLGATTLYGVISSGGTNAPTIYMNGATRGGATPTSASNAMVVALDGSFFITSSVADASTAKFILTNTGETQLKPNANNSVLTTSGAYSLTGSNASSLLDLAGTWNTTGNPTAIKLNITNTASGASAYLMDLQVGAATQFRVTKAGAIRTAAPTTGTANDWKLGTRVAATVALDTTQYIELEVGGTLYKLAIVT